MSYVKYVGDHPEPSIAFRIPASGPVWPHGILDGYATRRIESVCLPNRRWVIVNPFVAIWLAGARRREGPWVYVKISPPELAEIRRRAPWIRKAKDAVIMVDPDGLGIRGGLASLETLDAFHHAAVRPYEVVR